MLCDMDLTDVITVSTAERPYLRIQQATTARSLSAESRTARPQKLLAGALSGSTDATTSRATCNVRHRSLCERQEGQACRPRRSRCDQHETCPVKQGKSLHSAHNVMRMCDATVCVS